MFCPNCGSNLPDNSRFCASCGANIESSSQPQNAVYDEPTVSVYDEPVNAQPQYQAPVQPQYQAPVQPQYQAPVQPQYQAPVQPQYQAPVQPQYGNLATAELSMKWYKALISWLLFLGAGFNVLQAIRVLSGSIYDGEQELVYRFFDGLQGLDIFFSISCIAIAGFAVFVRFQLAGFKKIGPTLLYVQYAVTALIVLIYNISAIAIIEDAARGLALNTDDMITEVVISVLIYIIMMVLNIIYFNKRKHLFTN